MTPGRPAAEVAFPRAPRLCQASSRFASTLIGSSREQAVLPHSLAQACIWGKAASPAGRCERRPTEARCFPVKGREFDLANRLGAGSQIPGGLGAYYFMSVVELTLRPPTESQGVPSVALVQLLSDV